jgi:hypothetical protein
VGVGIRVGSWEVGGGDLNTSSNAFVTGRGAGLNLMGFCSGLRSTHGLEMKLVPKPISVRVGFDPRVKKYTRTSTRVTQNPNLNCHLSSNHHTKTPLMMNTSAKNMRPGLLTTHKTA